MGGKQQFPYMVDPNTGVAMYESDEIIKYLVGKYGDGQVPLLLSLGLLTTLTEGFAMIGRMGKGSSYTPSKLPPKPLEIWAYEPSPFCKIVREVLVELELPHILHSFYEVEFHDHVIQTVVTNMPRMVDVWVHEMEKHYCKSGSKVVVGLDIEWRPNRDTGITNVIATLQLCIANNCLIFQLIHTPEIPESLRDFLKNDSNIFVGVGVSDDAAKLERDYGLEVVNTADLRHLAMKANGGESWPRHAGLARLTEEILGLTLVKPKEITLSMWDNELLSEKQIEYACIDAFVSWDIGKHLI
nr:Werner Syndrome-like exonuclease [Ipomoea batatas]